MNLVLAIIAAVTAAAAGGLWYWRTLVGRELALMRATETANARDIAGKPSGALIELKGRLRTDTPLAAEFSGSACVYYRALIEREVEETTTESDGSRKTSRQYQTVTNVEKHAECRLEDATGAVAVDFEGAKVEALQSHQRYEPAGVSLVVDVLLGASGQTLGHRYTEWIVPAGIPVYVLGSVRDGGIVGADTSGKNPFIISHKFEEERERSLGRTRLWLLAGTVILALAAVGFLAWSVFAAAS